jgi:hypothetical protein
MRFLIFFIDFDIAGCTIAYTPFDDTFIIALGKSDEAGQFLEIIHQYKQEERIICRL